MGLAAVPFGTAQVHGKPTEYRIEVKRVNEEYRFKVTVAYSFKMEVVEKSDEMKIVWVRGLPRLFLSTKEHMIKESSVSIRKMSFNSFEDATVYIPSFAGVNRPIIDNLVRITRVPSFVKRWFCEAEEGGYVAKFDACEEEEENDRSAKPLTAKARIKALFEADRARREKDPELEKERMRREKAVINARNRIREFIRIDLESRKIKEGNKIGKNEIILEEPKCEDKKEEMSKVFFSKLSKEDYFKGFDAFKDKLNAEFKARLKKGKVEKNEITIEDGKKGRR